MGRNEEQGDRGAGYRLRVEGERWERVKRYGGRRERVGFRVRVS